MAIANIPARSHVIVELQNTDENLIPDNAVLQRLGQPLEEFAHQQRLPGLRGLFKDLKLPSSPLVKSVEPEGVFELERFAAEKNEGERLSSLTRFWVIDISRDHECERTLVENLRANPNVRAVFPDPKTTRPIGENALASVNRCQVRSHPQSYFGNKESGDALGIRWAWAHDDCALGCHSRIFDLEPVWGLRGEDGELHEDLRGASLVNVPRSSDPRIGTHGLYVVGVLSAQHNDRGIAGVVPKAEVVLQSINDDGSCLAHVDAIMGVLNRSDLSRGDTILLQTAIQANASPCNKSIQLPLELHPAVFRAIKIATDSGFVVIEPAGNTKLCDGSPLDLDDGYSFEAVSECYGYPNIFNTSHMAPDSEDFRDSGAIVVAASGSPTEPHYPRKNSVRGKRIDVFAPGNGISTLKFDGSTPTYSRCFSSTSAASALVAGCVASFQSVAETSGGPLGPPEIRRLLRNSGARPTETGGIDKIGVMPNLRVMIEKLGEMR